jgi:hypothetical protein
MEVPKPTERHAFLTYLKPNASGKKPEPAVHNEEELLAMLGEVAERFGLTVGARGGKEGGSRRVGRRLVEDSGWTGRI